MLRTRFRRRFTFVLFLGLCGWGRSSTPWERMFPLLLRSQTRERSLCPGARGASASSCLFPFCKGGLSFPPPGRGDTEALCRPVSWQRLAGCSLHKALSTCCIHSLFGGRCSPARTLGCLPPTPDADLFWWWEGRCLSKGFESGLCRQLAAWP